MGRLYDATVSSLLSPACSGKNEGNSNKLDGLILKSICMFLIEVQKHACFVINGSSLVFKFKFKKNKST